MYCFYQCVRVLFMLWMWILYLLYFSCLFSRKFPETQKFDPIKSIFPICTKHWTMSILSFLGFWGYLPSLLVFSVSWQGQRSFAVPCKHRIEQETSGVFSATTESIHGRVLSLPSQPCPWVYDSNLLWGTEFLLTILNYLPDCVTLGHAIMLCHVCLF